MATVSATKNAKVLATVVFADGTKKECNVSNVQRNSDGSHTGTVKRAGKNVSVIRAKGKRNWAQDNPVPVICGVGVSDSWRND